MRKTSMSVFSLFDQVAHTNGYLQYDMLTAPITNAHFQARVLTALSTYFAELQASPTKQLPLPLITPLSPADTLHSPNDSISQLLALTSPWIDLASPDPVIAHISRQVFTLEIAYAAFCGFGNVVIQGPKLHHNDLHGQGIARYARAIQEALTIGQYINIQILLPMIDDPNDESHDDVGNLSRFVRDEYLSTSEPKENREVDIFGSWDAWNVIRTVCKYSQRVSVGKKTNYLLHFFPVAPFLSLCVVRSLVPTFAFPEAATGSLQVLYLPLAVELSVRLLITRA